MRSHFRASNAALACAVSGATAMMTGVCSAQFAAADYATDPAYAGGWSNGQNGGYGFNAWNLNGNGAGNTWSMTGSSPLGTAWTMHNGDLANAGRGFAPLQVGQTLETFIQNPSQTFFYRGYTIRLGSGTDNSAVERAAAYTFEYYSYGKWFVGDGTGNHGTTLNSTDTHAAGMKLDFTLTGANSYHLSMTPLNNPGNAYTIDGTLKNSGDVDYLLFQYYNGPNSTQDFYISSLTISQVPEPSSMALISLGIAGLAFLRRRK